MEPNVPIATPAMLTVAFAAVSSVRTCARPNAVGGKRATT